MPYFDRPSIPCKNDLVERFNSTQENSKKQETLTKDDNEKSEYQHFCIVVGKKYLIKAIALYNSLQRNSRNFHLWICCLDQLTYKTLKSMNLENINIFKVEELEDDLLRKVKKEREINEYCWTLKAPLIEYLLTTHKLHSMVYCDSDLYFFSDPTPLFKEWHESSVFLCPQRDLDWVEKKYGLYQAGLIGFKNDKIGLESLRWWKKQCLEWCFAKPEDDKFGDQKYLDQLPYLFPHIKVSKHLGINAAPWNCIYNNDYKMERINNQLYIEKDPLIAFHFACLKIFNEDEFDLWSLDTLIIQGIIIREIYIPYLEEIQTVISMLRKMQPKLLNKLFDRPKMYFPYLKRPLNILNKLGIKIPVHVDNGFSKAKTSYKFTPFKRKMNQWDDFYNFCTIVSEEYLVKGLTLYDSLKNHGDNFHLWFCCVDDMSFAILSEMKLSNATILSVKEIESRKFQKVKQSRTLQEYCWTLKSQLCLYVLDSFREVDRLVYSDADQYFFSNPKPLFDEWGTASMFMCSQRAAPELGSRYGYYQAGLLGFKQEENSRNILNWWKEKCLEWCFDKNDQTWNRWGDQKYLEHIPHLFENIKIIRNIGVNAAPWNLVMNDLYTVYKKNKKTMLDDTELVTYHFGSMLILNEEEFDLWKLEKLNFTPETIEYIYTPYIQDLQKNISSLQPKEDNQDILYQPMNLFRHAKK